MSASLTTAYRDIQSHLRTLSTARESTKIGRRILQQDVASRDSSWSVTFGSPQVFPAQGREFRWLAPFAIHWCKVSNVHEADSYADAVEYQTQLLSALLTGPYDGYAFAAMPQPDEIAHESDDSALTFLGCIRGTITLNEPRS